ncbi:ADP-ribosylglycohydrolase family protein [uncultured Selenomonas sp.]|uniref:ADP-ribosylglycohydrolase family protein n=1 Tax=uncultured Selenomonas sp. TaxID=159275 RepID=UPI0025D8B3C3|nr:ADP-ribosylglycohydrolase family protein [uncultured Selenomonas sp.]
MIYCLLTTGSYKECVLKAVNLGEDTDTVGAIAGGLAGLAYGRDEIPQKWKEALLKKEQILLLCQEFAKQFANG